MADYTPVNGGDLAETVTFTAGAAITGGQCLSVSGVDTVIPAPANATTYAGIAAHDAASTAPVTVYTGSGIIHETPAGATLTAGSLVYNGSAIAGAVGTASTGYTMAIGVAVRTIVSTTGTVLRWKSLVG